MEVKPQYYSGREQSGFKHVILKKYLQELAYKTCSAASRWEGITFVDGFAGPWEDSSHDFKDTSFGIALRTLEGVKNDPILRKSLRIRLRLNEVDSKKFKRLVTVLKLKRFEDTTVICSNSEFESAVPKITAEMDENPRQFYLVLVDPKGWKGFSMEQIAPLFNRRNVEVIVNIMTSFIARFVTLEEQRENFEQLFGNPKSLDRVRSRSGAVKREVELVREYIECLKMTCGFKFACSATILNPKANKTHYHLVFGTNNSIGIKVFKNHEEKAFPIQEQTRARIAHAKRGAQDSYQGSLFSAEELHDRRFTNHLKSGALETMNANFCRYSKIHKKVSYDKFFCDMMEIPFLWKPDLDRRLFDERQAGTVEIRFGGSNPNRRRKPDVDRGDSILFL